MKQYLFTIIKIGLPLAILVWLVSGLDRDELRSLGEQSIRWPLLGVGFGLTLAAVCATFVRWHLLIRTLDLPLRLSEVLRLSFLGYLLNFVSFGSVGGDLFKAVFLVRAVPGRKTEAVATVFLDRVVGLYTLLIVASAAILWADTSGWTADLKAIGNLTLVATLAGTAAIIVTLMPRWERSTVIEALQRLPKIGATLRRLMGAVDVYRGKRGLLALIAGLSLAVHVAFAFALYLAAVAIFPRHPTLAEHLIIVPLSLVAGAIPLAPAGLGTFEAAMKILYRVVPATGDADGFLVALTFRLITIVIATIGAGYYLARRQEVGALLREAEQSQRPRDGR